MGCPGDFKLPCAVISRLTTLGFNPSVIIMRHDSKTAKHEDLVRLKKAGLLPTKGQLEGRLRPEGIEPLVDILPRELFPKEHAGPPGRLDDRKAENDLLGVYIPGKEVVVYDVMCELVAARLELDVEALKNVVAAHEVTHAITHLGTDRRNRKWDTYSFEMWKNDREMFAQVYALFCFKEVGDNRAVEVFRRLSDHQSKLYNSWASYEDSAVEDVNILLFSRRLEKLPPIDQDVDEDNSSGIGFASFADAQYECLRAWLSEMVAVLQDAIDKRSIQKEVLKEYRERLRVFDDIIEEDYSNSSANCDARKYKTLEEESFFVYDQIGQLTDMIKEQSKIKRHK